MDLRAKMQEGLPRIHADLAALVAIPSVSAEPAHRADVDRAADAVVALLTDLGCPDARVVAEGGMPAVIGRFPPPEGQPTVCLYAHLDVQPTGRLADWTSDPFTAEQRGDRLYGRGAGDDKGALAVHLAALRAFDGHPPVGVTVFVEGEEEVGSASLGRLLQAHAEELAADLYVIADSGNWSVGEPAFTTTLRGLADCVVEVSVLDHGIHSGGFGGAVPDALTALSRLLATLHDEDGSVAVAGLRSADAPDLDYPVDRLRAEAGLLDGVQLIGTGSVVSRLWAQPAIAVIGLDTTSIADSSNTLIPHARAKISLRVAPGDDAKQALTLLTEHLEGHAPWGARVRVTPGVTGEPSIIPFSGPMAEAARSAFAEAWGKEPVFVGQGGSIPMVADFAQAFPAASVFVTAVCDPDSRAHGPDESVHLGDLARACLAETLLLDKLSRLAD